MSHPIKIVEDSNQSPAKIISICQSNLINQNQNFENSLFCQSNQVNSPNSSITLNKFTELSTLSNNILFNEEKFFPIKENKPTEFEQIIKFNEPIFKSDFKSINNSINGEEKLEQKNVWEPKLIPNTFPFVSQTNQISFDIKDKDILNKENYNQVINKKKENINFNNCLNNNIIDNERKKSLKNLKEISSNIAHTLELMCSKYDFLLNHSDDANINTLKKMNVFEDRNLNVNKEEKKDIKIYINLLNSKNINQKENILSSPKLNLNFIEKEKNKKPFLNINKTKNNFKQKNQDIKDENNITNNSPAPHPRVKNLKRINNRKFNIKSRGLRYNILTEEMKKQLLLDAMSMRTVEVAKKYGISTRNVNRWKKKGIQRKKGSGRKFKDPRLERKILEWYRMQDKENLTSKQFKEKAIELSDNKTFRASSGWLTNMKRKYNINFKKY